MAANKKFDVFFSHNSKDEPWVIQLKNSLEARGIEVWLDSDDIRPGEQFARALEQGIRESKAVALIISPESMSSSWVEAEYYRALTLATNKELQLIPVLYKKAQIPGFLQDRSWVDFSDPTKYDENVNTLIWGITGRKPAGPPQKKPKNTPNAPIRNTVNKPNIPPTPLQSSQAPQNAASKQGPINEPVDTPLELFVQFVLSAALLVGLTLAIRSGISMKLFGSSGIVEWIRASANPRLTLWVVSTLFAAVIITLPKIGIKSEWSDNFSQINHLLYTYLIGLPLWVTVPIIAAAAVGLIVLQPVCQSPNATIQVRSTSIGSMQYMGTPIQAKAGETLLLSASSNDSAVFFCAWSSTGSIIRSLGPKSVCNTQVRLEEEPGRGIVTLTLSNSSCSVVTTTPLEIITVP